MVAVFSGHGATALMCAPSSARCRRACLFHCSLQPRRSLEHSQTMWKLFPWNGKHSGKCDSLLLAPRSQCHFCKPVSNGPIRNGGLGFPKDPAAPLHRTHGCPGLQAATGPWWWDLHEGECHCLYLYWIWQVNEGLWYNLPIRTSTIIILKKCCSSDDLWAE